MRYEGVRRLLPPFLDRYILDFEVRIDDAVRAFAASLPAGALVLDAGAGESQHAPMFPNQRYVAVDLGVGDSDWNYRELDCVANLEALPFRPGSFQGCLNVVTLEHVREPARVLAELASALEPGGRLLLIVPHQWEVHQQPHDYFRYTRYGVRYLLERAGFTEIDIQPMGGFFRLLARRLLNGLQFFRGILFPLGVVLLAPPAMILPLFDGLDREHNFTLGYICTAQKPS